MRIAFFEVADWEIPIIKKSLKKHNLKFFKEPLGPDNVSKVKDAEVISVFIYSRVGCDLLAKMPKLKLITTRSTGYDHLDLSACNDGHVVVCNVPFYGENTVAEHTFALILSLSRNVHKSYMRSLKDDFSTEGLIGFDIKGKTLGVVGAGHIGLHVIKIAKGFGMNVVAFDVHQDRFLSEVLGFEYAPLEDVIRKSDIVTIHTPYNKHTHHLINMKNISLFRKGSLLINTSRGGVVDSRALLHALKKGILAGAGLDVIEGEELIKEEKEILHKKRDSEEYKKLLYEQEILDMENVVFTPHIAFYSQEALLRILNTTLENIHQFCSGQAKNKVVYGK